MAVRRRSGPFVRSGASERKTVWAGIVPASVALGSGVAVLQGTFNASALARRPFTVVRTHIHWSLQSDQVIATENQYCSLGLAIVSDQAIAIGITAVPTPITDIGSDLFFLHSTLISDFTFVSAVGFSSGNLVQESVDSKAMRKVDGDQDLALVLENAAFTSGSTLAIGGRMLLKLH